MVIPRVCSLASLWCSRTLPPAPTLLSLPPTDASTACSGACCACLLYLQLKLGCNPRCLLPSNSDCHAPKAGASAGNSSENKRKPVLLQHADGSQKLVFRRDKTQSAAASLSAASAAAAAAAAATVHNFVELAPIRHDKHNEKLVDVTLTIALSFAEAPPAGEFECGVIMC